MSSSLAWLRLALDLRCAADSVALSVAAVAPVDSREPVVSSPPATADLEAAAARTGARFSVVAKSALRPPETKEKIP